MKNKILSYCLISLIIIAVLFLALPYAFPLKAMNYPEDGYELNIENPYAETTLDFDGDEIIKYLSENKFRRISGAGYTFETSKTIFIVADTLENHHTIQLAYNVEDYRLSRLVVNSKYYRLSKDDFEYLQNLFFNSDIN